jgi:aminotransferase
MLEIAKIAEEYDLVVVSDEIYDRLVYGFEHVCFPALGESIKRRTVLLGGFSKSHAMTGWRIGYAAAPAEIHRAGAHPPVHHHVRADHRAGCRHRSPQERRTARAGHAGRIQPPPKTDRRRAEQPRPRHLRAARRVLRLPQHQASGMDDETFAEKLLHEEHVAVVPGSAFGLGGQGFVRCSYATAYEKIEEALRRMEKFMVRGA